MASVYKISLLSETGIAATTNGEPVALEGNQINYVGLARVANRAADTYTCKIQRSWDKVNWVDYITFPAISTNKEEFVIPADDAGAQYVRAVCTLGAVGTADVTIDLMYDKRR